MTHSIELEDIDDAELTDVIGGKNQPQHVAVTALQTAFDDLKRIAADQKSSSSSLMMPMMMMAMMRRR